MIVAPYRHVLLRIFHPSICSWGRRSRAVIWLLLALQLSGGWTQYAMAEPSEGISDTMRVGWYGPGFDGDYTASGEVFSRYDYTAAHPSWPFGTLIQLTNPRSGSTVVVRVNDRSGGALDISEQAARDLDTYSTGISAVAVEILQWGE